MAEDWRAERVSVRAAGQEAAVRQRSAWPSARPQSRHKTYGGVDMKRVHALIVACIMLAACVSTGVDVKPEQLSNFIPGFSTLDDVIGQLGAPTSQAKLRNGSTILIYSFATSRPHPESFIPFIGPLFSGGGIRSTTVLLEFDENGVLRSQLRTTSSEGSGWSVLHPGALP